MKFLIKTFGCKTNQYESEGVREGLLEEGFSETLAESEAEVLIINTCTVTSRAGASCRNFINKVKRQNPEIRVIVTGCAVDVKEGWLKKVGAEKYFTNSQKHLIAAYLREDTPFRNAIEDEGKRFGFSINSFEGHTRAFLKIQDGCENFCSYCIIPYARGKPQSRKLEEVIKEARQLVASGYHELVLTGINIGAYNFEGVQLPGLLKELAKIEGLLRLRLGSVEPIYVTDDLLYAIKENEKICSHLHLPLQAGADNILSLMNRKYTLSEYFKVLERTREILDTPSITTDIIVGFPGENEESSATTLKTIERAGFARSHIFLFSPREGTPAAKMKAAPQRETDARRKVLTAVCEKVAASYIASLVGKEETVMIERECEIGWEGYTSRYIRAELGGDFKKGELVKVLIKSAFNDHVLCEALK